MNPSQPPSGISLFFSHLWQILCVNSWPWWTAGICLGLTAVALAWVTGRRLGVTGGYEDACSAITNDSASYQLSPSQWKFWFILGLPVGALIANLGHWNWSFLYGRLDAMTFGGVFWKLVWLLVAGVLIGYGARWARGCVSGNTIMGVALGNKMSIYATLAFLAAGIIIANLLFKVM